MFFNSNDLSLIAVCLLLDMFLQNYTICLCLTLECSEYDAKVKKEVVELYKSMVAKQPKLGWFLNVKAGKNDLHLGRDDDGINVCSDKDGINLDGEDSRAEESAAVELETSASKSGKAKNKKKNKPRKGKGGKKK